jgi:hypothetical protein
MQPLLSSKTRPTLCFELLDPFDRLEQWNLETIDSQSGRRAKRIEPYFELYFQLPFCQLPIANFTLNIIS